MVLLNRKKRVLLVLLFAILAGIGAVFLYFHNPSEGRGFIPCPIYEITGYYCTGCGTTRALYSILHLDFLQAFRFNAALCLLLPFLISYAAVCCVQFIRYGWIPFNQKLSSKWLIYLAVLLIAFGIIRNFIPALQPTVLA